MKKLVFFLISTIVVANISAQKIVPLTNKDGISIRGLSVLDDNHAWISGSKGTVAKTSDGGKTWHWMEVAQYPNSDFRDIELVDSQTAIIMVIDTPAIILRTKDKGLSWEKVFEDQRSGMFLDAMSFDGQKAAIVGDPINNQLFIATSTNQGKSWKENNNVSNKTGGCFASSGTNIAWRNNDFCIVTGGLKSFLIYKKQTVELPITKGKETTGANSIAINPDAKSNIAAVIVGGDFNNKTNSDSNCVLVTSDFFNKKSSNTIFQKPIEGPKGYKSCVLFIDKNRLVATGTSGTDISEDQGLHWKHISDIPFHTVQKAKNGQLILLAGPNGSIAKLEF